MSVVQGRAITLGSGGAAGGLKWTVSLTEPAAPKAGDLWVKADPAELQFDKVIQLQTSQKAVDSPRASAIYLLIPREGYPLPSDLVTVPFVDGKRYSLTADCPYMLLTDSAGAELDLPRGVYTGSEWHMWGLAPEKPTSWQFLTAINADSTWTPPEANAWYRIHVFGKCGDGYNRPNSGTYNNKGYPGGNSGGYACSSLLLSEPVVCTVNASVTSFGRYLSATAGGSGGEYAASTVLGQGTGGTDYNLKGFTAGVGTSKSGSGTQGGNKGMMGGYAGSSSNSYGGGGGGGARLPTPYDNFPYVPNDLTAYRAGYGGWSDVDAYDGRHNYGSGRNAAAYPALNLSAPILYGGGGGSGGNALSWYTKDDNDVNCWGLGGVASAGSPGLIIIEKGAQ